MQEAAFLGLGLLGSALAHAALERGEKLVVWNRNPQKAEAFLKLGAHLAQSAAEAAQQAGRIHLVLTDDAAVDSVLEGCGALAATTVVIDHSTTAPAATAERARRLAERGVAFLHAPVFMSPSMARSGQGKMIVSGPRTAFERVEPALRRMAAHLEYLGERADLAAAHKLITMSLVLSCSAGLADALALAESLAVPPAEAHARLMQADLNSVVARRGLAMINRDFAPSVDIATVKKDTDIELAAAAAAKIRVPTLTAIAARLDELIQRGHGGDDIAVLAIDAVKPRAPY